MRKLVITVLLLAVLAYGFPLVNESSSTPCNALERRFVAQATRDGATGDPDIAALGGAFLGSLQTVSNGSFAVEYVRREHPNVPSGVACVAEYWKSFLPGAEPHRRS